MFGMKALSYPGAGAMGSITLGVVSSYLWDSGLPKQLALHDKNSQFADIAEHQISILWTIAFEPLLFGCIGSSLSFDLIPPGTLLKSLGIVCIGSICRVFAAFLVTARCSYSIKERIFISLAWMAKATVQAALCSFPLLLAKEVYPYDHPLHQHYIQWGNQILSTAILSICLTAPLGVICIQALGQRWLEKREIEQVDDEACCTSGSELIKSRKKTLLELDDLIQKIDATSPKSELLVEAREILSESKIFFAEKVEKNA